MANPETTGAERADFATRFQPGNPGRPKGAKHKLTEDFLKDVQAAWSESGKAAIVSMIAEKPGDFVKMVAGLVPKDLNLNLNDASEMTDDELAERVRTLASQLAPFLPGGTGNADEGADGATGEALASRVH
jgi:hypothetical protein